ncbi:MAG: hypothetical protein AB7O04_00635 [Hyphomonadaceae bacterium]
MFVPARYIAAAFFLAFLPGAALAGENCHSCNRPPPPPPPQQGCNQGCQPPRVVIPPPVVPQPNIVVVNAGARAQASAMAIAIANVEQGDTTIRVSGGGYASAGASAIGVTQAALNVTESVTRSALRDVRISAICIDARGNPHPASQTFGESDVAEGYAGEIYRCMAGTRMRVTKNGETFDCAAGEALWHENGEVTCRTQIARRPCNERSLLRRYGPGEKLVRIRTTETVQEARSESAIGAMTMDGGVGQGVW